MSQDRMQNVGETQQVGSTPTSGQGPNIEATLAAARRATSKVRVIHGSNEGYFDLSGKTVGSVKKSLRQVFNIPGDAEAVVNDKQVGDDFILESGQHLEFVKDTGVKG